MASTQTWSEWNGVGQTETTSRAEMNLKNLDDSTTAYSSATAIIAAGNNSFGKYQSVKFAGTFNTLSSLTYKIDVNSGTGLSYIGAVKTAYVQPATTATGDGAMSTSGAAANFNNGTDGFAAGTATTTTNPVYANPIRLQLQTTSSAVPGDTTSRTITAAWTES